MNQPRLFIGIDGGGTHSYGVAVNESGRVLATAHSGSLNFHGSGLERARSSLSDLIASLQLTDPDQAEFFVIGCAALFTDSTEAEKEQFCGGIVPMARARLVGDCVTAYHGACLSEPGVLVIAGTGSIVLVRNEAGEFSQLGGWGHLLGDAGSAWWIAQESIKAAIAASEDLGPPTDLAALIRRFYEVKDLSDIIPIVYDSGFSKDKFAALAGYLAIHADEDEGFRQICQRAGENLAAQALAAATRAKLNRDPLPLYLSGAVLHKNSLVRESLIAAMLEARPVIPIAPRMPALLGAAAMALADGGVAVTEEILITLETSYRDVTSR